MHGPTRLGTPTGCTPSALYLPPTYSIPSLVWPAEGYRSKTFPEIEWRVESTTNNSSTCKVVHLPVWNNPSASPARGLVLAPIWSAVCHEILRVAAAAALLIRQPRAGACCGTSSLTSRQRKEHQDLGSVIIVNHLIMKLLFRFGLYIVRIIIILYWYIFTRHDDERAATVATDTCHPEGRISGRDGHE